MSVLKCLLSYAWPVPVWEGPGKYGPLRLVWESGHLVVNSGNANQSRGSLHEVWQQCFADANVAERPHATALILGFGAGSAASILRRELGLDTLITGVDGDPEMLRIAKEWFKMDQMPGLTLIESDALQFANAHETGYGLVLVDLCHELDLAPGVDGPEFISRLRSLTAPNGQLFFNTIVHDERSGTRSQRVGELLRLHFEHVEEHHYQGMNRVFTAK